jgi:hypothetical protein
VLLSAPLHCGKPLDVATLHEDVIPSFQTAQYHQSSEFDRARPTENWQHLLLLLTPTDTEP